MVRTKFCVFFILMSACVLAQTITLHVTGIRSNSGSIRIQFFDTKKNFDDEKPLFTKTAPKMSMNGGALIVSYAVKPGTYGIAILDDENNNQKMDYGLLLPKEGFGFSDYYHTGMSQPDFRKFSFVMGNASKTVFIKLRYL